MLNKQIVRTLKDYKTISIWSNYMFGLPGETCKDIEATCDLIDILSKENRKFFSGISIYTPFPQTPLYEKALECGFEPPKSLEEWGEYQYNDVANLPWLKGRLRRMVRTLGLFTHFQFNQPLELNVAIPKSNIFYVIASLLLSLSARLRWKHKIFGMPMEWRIYEGLTRILNVAER